MIRGVRKGDNNMTFNKLTGLFLALTVFTMFSGCSRKEDTNWLIGEWIVDANMTAANMTPEAKTKLKAQIDAFLAEQPPRTADSTVPSPTSTERDNGGRVRGGKFLSAALTFTSTQGTVTGPDGIGSTSSYSILKKPDDNTLVIKWDGEVATVTRSGEYLMMSPPSGDLQFNGYWRRKN